MSGQAIKDKAAMTDHIADCRHEQWPSWSIDTLLAHPVEALELCIEVAKRSGRISNKKAAEFRKALESLGEKFGNEVDIFNEICRTAMTARKSGDLKRDKH